MGVTTLVVACALSVFLMLDLRDWQAAAAAAPVTVLNLDGKEWRVGNSNWSVSYPATVPGGIYSDLLAAKVIEPDFFYGYNDKIYRWVAKKNWTYSRTFQVDYAIATKRHVQLVLHGADTVGEVWLNDKLLGTFNNMFVRHVFATENALRVGDNRLVINFVSPVEEAERLYNAYARRHGYYVVPHCVPAKYNGECHANHLRKMQASFAWDWGPAFPSVGLWKSVQLEAFDSAVLRDVMVQFVDPETENGTVSLKVQAFLEAGSSNAGPVQGTLRAQLRLPEKPVFASKTVILSPGAGGHCETNITIDGLEDVPRWWPNGEGDQPLMDLFVVFTSEDGKEDSTLKRRVAYRTVVLIQEPIGISPLNPQPTNISDNEEGLTFYFRVNGRAIFAKGSNWIPAHILPEHGTDPARVRRLLTSARDANMNMLRVWGGGVYESDYFYDVADELGILIWQDFMFACSMYPANKKFLSSVHEEVTQQVRRLHSHPSVAIWAGNNENEGALVQNWYGTAGNPEYKRDYLLLYVSTIRATVKSMDPTRPFVVSSPSNGLKTDESIFISSDPASQLYGDVHHYDYTSNGGNADVYPIPRFASEYGFQSMPYLATLRAVATNRRDLAAGSRWSRSRQHLDGGYLKMAHLIGFELPLPANWSLPENFFPFIFYSQISQALMVQTQTEHYRRLRSQLFSDKRGLCMGALYWQLNDVWQAPSWSSIDFNGRWKPLHYFAQEFFYPQMASAYLNTEKELVVFALNDAEDPVLSVVLQASAGRWNQRWIRRDPMANYKRVWTNLTGPFTMNESSSQFVLKTPIQTLIQSLPGCNTSYEYCYLELRLLAMADGTRIGPIRPVFPVPLKEARLQFPNIMVVSVSDPDSHNRMEVVIESDRPAAFVWLETNELAGRFSRNAFLMSRPQETVYFIPDDPKSRVKAAQLLNTITANSLTNKEQKRGYDSGQYVMKRSATIEGWLLNLLSLLT